MPGGQVARQGGARNSRAGARRGVIAGSFSEGIAEMLLVAKSWQRGFLSEGDCIICFPSSAGQNDERGTATMALYRTTLKLAEQQRWSLSSWVVPMGNGLMHALKGED